VTSRANVCYRSSAVTSAPAQNSALTLQLTNGPIDLLFRMVSRAWLCPLSGTEGTVHQAPLTSASDPLANLSVSATLASTLKRFSKAVRSVTEFHCGASSMVRCLSADRGAINKGQEN
jgi:hypothetical protein